MKNLLISLGLGALISVAFTASTLLTPGESALPGVMAAIVAFFVLARKTLKAMGVPCSGDQRASGRPPRTANALKVRRKRASLPKLRFVLKFNRQPDRYDPLHAAGLRSSHALPRALSTVWALDGLNDARSYPLQKEKP